MNTTKYIAIDITKKFINTGRYRVRLYIESVDGSETLQLLGETTVMEEIDRFTEITDTYEETGAVHIARYIASNHGKDVDFSEWIAENAQDWR